jgi:4-methylaminobutanoate oxidase (formaldehyde-forming)
VLDQSDPFVWGGEPILRDGVPVGDVTSAGFSDSLGRAVMLGYVRGDAPVSRDFVLSGKYEIDVAGQRVSASVRERPVYPAAAAAPARAKANA